MTSGRFGAWSAEVPARRAVLVGLAAGVLAQRLSQSSSAPTPAAAAIVRLLNARRAAAHLEPLRVDGVLSSLARIHNRDELRGDFFAHDAPTGQTFAERLAYLHRREIGEVLAWGTGGFATPAGIVSLWMASPEHRRIILTPELRRVGVSVLAGRFQGERSARVATADFST